MHLPGTVNHGRKHEKFHPCGVYSQVGSRSCGCRPRHSSFSPLPQTLRVLDSAAKRWRPNSPLSGHFASQIGPVNKKRGTGSDKTSGRRSEHVFPPGAKASSTPDAEDFRSGDYTGNKEDTVEEYFLTDLSTAAPDLRSHRHSFCGISYKRRASNSRRLMALIVLPSSRT